MSEKIVIAHARPAVGEALAWSLRFSYYYDVVYVQDVKEVGTKFVNASMLLTDLPNFELLVQTGHLPEYPVIVLADDVESDKIIEALFAGASSIADASKGPESIIEKVQQILRQQPNDENLLLHKIIHLKTAESQQDNHKDYNLSAKEKEILKLMRNGLHLKLIAHQTGITYETVRTHVKHIYKKIGVMSASEALIKAMKMNL